MNYYIGMENDKYMLGAQVDGRIKSYAGMLNINKYIPEIYQLDSCTYNECIDIIKGYVKDTEEKSKNSLNITTCKRLADFIRTMERVKINNFVQPQEGKWVLFKDGEILNRYDIQVIQDALKHMAGVARDTLKDYNHYLSNYKNPEKHYEDWHGKRPTEMRSYGVFFKDEILKRIEKDGLLPDTEDIWRIQIPDKNFVKKGNDLVLYRYEVYLGMPWRSIDWIDVKYRIKDGYKKVLEDLEKRQQEYDERRAIELPAEQLKNKNTVCLMYDRITELNKVFNAIQTLAHQTIAWQLSGLCSDLVDFNKGYLGLFVKAGIILMNHYKDFSNVYNDMVKVYTNHFNNIKQV